MTETSNIDSINDDVSRLRSDFDQSKNDLMQKPDSEAIDQLRIQYLGRKGALNKLMEQLKSLDREAKPLAGKIINELRQHLNTNLEELITKSKQWEIEKVLASQPIDISLPGRSIKPEGSLHPVTLVRETLLDEFRKLGFMVADGPELDLDFYNFGALNFQDDHPARDMQDTFFIESEEKLVLRTHTSNIQIHTMLQNQPPLRVVAPGRVYRCDSDLTHTPMFHQIEGLVVDLNISMADMKGVVDRFLKAIFGGDLETRLRPSFFPFVEPGAEIDLACVACKGSGCRICSMTGWLEIGGLGMVHPNVFEATQIDSEKYTGFAFGFGIDRIAMLKYGLGDLRQLFEGNQPFLGQFALHPQFN